MALRFTTLASGSRGNSAVLDYHGHALLIDAGISARALNGRLKRTGLGIANIREVLLTHTHGDHFNDSGMTLLAENDVVLWCHAGHHQEIGHKPGFHELKSRNLVRFYEDRPFTTCIGVEVAPFELRHGHGKTFGFRLDINHSQHGRQGSVGYFADLGCWNHDLAAHFSDCDALAIEFNHDVKMTLDSGRHPALIERNLSNDGHLSNAQAATLLESILKIPASFRLKNLVQLHLSDQCNSPELAQATAQRTLAKLKRPEICVQTAPQGEPLPWIELAAPPIENANPFDPAGGWTIEFQVADPGEIEAAIAVAATHQTGKRGKNKKVDSGQQHFEFMV